MHNFYTNKILRKNTVTVLIEKIIDPIKKTEIKQFVANLRNSVITFIIPDDIINVLGRLFKKHDHLELGYLVEEDIWFILKKGEFLWSNKILRMEPKKEEIRHNRFTALTKKFIKKS